MHSTPIFNRDQIKAFLPVMLVLTAAVAWHAGASNATSTSIARPPAQPTATATIDIVEVFEQLNERDTLEAQLKSRRDARVAQLEEINTRIQAIQTDLETTLKPGTDEYKEKVREFMEQRAVAEARRNALQQIISIDQGALRRQLYSKIEAAVTKIADRDGIDVVILDDSTFPIPEDASDNDVYRAIITKGVIYRHESIDLTQRVITLMNNEYAAP